MYSKKYTSCLENSKKVYFLIKRNFLFNIMAVMRNISMTKELDSSSLGNSWDSF